MQELEKILRTHQMVVEEGYKRTDSLKYRSYAISILRGGVGKSTLAFNLAYELSKIHPMLIADMCAQCNLTENLMRGESPDITIMDILQPILLGSAFGIVPENQSYHIKGTNASFLIPGSQEMFSLPSILYQHLYMANASNNPYAIKFLLESLKTVLDVEDKAKKSLGILIDTSPFYAGGTHLAWCAADALVIPVRTDENSIKSLRLTLELLANPNKDFRIWNERAGGRPAPKIAAIVMTMVGYENQQQAIPDRASRLYIERALSVAMKYPELFDCGNPANAFAITGIIGTSSHYDRELSYITSML